LRIAAATGSSWLTLLLTITTTWRVASPLLQTAIM
jgi:hypothetical protein